MISSSAYESLAYDQTATRRKSARRAIREILGTSRDNAPHALTTLRAASHLSMLLDDATAGNMTLMVRRGNAVTAISINEAIALVRGAAEARTTS